jgi:dynactin 1
MRIHIEDLEAIKEMNDEMEEAHVENEKHLQGALGNCRSHAIRVEFP